MKSLFRSSVLGLGLALMGAGSASAGLSVGISAGSNGVDAFYLAIGDHYRVPQRDVLVVRQSRIADDEIPVVFFLAQKARVAPAVIVRLRHAGYSWYRIANHYRLGPDVFYVALKRPMGPYYGVYRDYQRTPRTQWSRIRMTDRDVVNFVNLRFLSEQGHCSADDIVDRRSKGGDFRDIHRDLRAGKRGEDRRADVHGRDHRSKKVTVTRYHHRHHR
jgi:hypothetical protein